MGVIEEESTMQHELCFEVDADPAGPILPLYPRGS